jgi:hypothetical protein
MRKSAITICLSEEREILETQLNKNGVHFEQFNE